VQLRSAYVLRRNLEALLKARGQTQHDLAQWCRRSDPWLSKILDENANRGLPLKYLDRIADFFGIATYQLFQPGITPLLERRKGERRRGLDRRVAHADAVLRDPSQDWREFSRLWASARPDDRKAAYAQLLELGLQRNGEPNTTPAAAPLATGAATRPATRSHRRTRS
jgi:transcriptional regulator with XRE-family HTH domain